MRVQFNSRALQSSKSHVPRSVMDMNAVAPGLTVVELKEVASPLSLLSN
jgi:hypothetical protein